VRRARVVHVLLVLVTVCAAARADQIDTLARTIEGDGSEKARIAAAVALGRLADVRGFAPLTRALAIDASPVVRGVAASALGHLGDVRAIPALERALSDPSDGVRMRARDALDHLRPTERERIPTETANPTKARFAPREPPRRTSVHVAVNRMGHKAPSSQHLTDRMHDLVVRQLLDAPGVSVSETGDMVELIVDGAITKLKSETRGPYVEVTCEVRLTVSNASGSLLSIVSGGATVQSSRGSFRQSIEGSLQAEALDNAVRGVQGNLLGFLARPR
jgi:hypothetical protein